MRYFVKNKEDVLRTYNVKESYRQNSRRRKKKSDKFLKPHAVEGN